MKIFRFVSIAAAAVALLTSCNKEQSQAEKDAEVERRVQERLAAERSAAEQERLAQQAADLDAREKALADKQSAASTRAIATATPRREEIETRTRVTSSERGEPRGYETFYRKLEPYGAWRETSDYGYVWQPRAARESRQWRPYTDGRWAYTDAGWTWVSDEPFGWATYHYGRWTRLSGLGWVWVPGDEWAPAWVSWREGGDHVGWAPLPPEAHFERGKGIQKWADSYYDIDADEYVFVPDEYIGAENVERYTVPPERNVTIVNQTTNVTNITYSNNIVINQGPSYDELRGRARQAPPRLRLEREYDVRENEAPRANIVGDTLALVAPLITNRAAERPRTEGAPVTQTRVERNWASGNQAEAQQAREKMRAEATAPPDAPAKRYDKPVVTDASPAPSTAPVATAVPTAAPVATPEPTSAVSATPRHIFSTPTPGATATPSATATASRSVAPTVTATPRVTPVATAMPRLTATPTATPRLTPTSTATAPLTPTATATPRLTPTPTATPRLTPAATATATAAASAAPKTTATPVATATPPPRVVPTPRASATPAATATPRPIATPTLTPSVSASPSPASDNAPSPIVRGTRNAGEEELRPSGDEFLKRQGRGSRLQPTPSAPPVAPVRGVTPHATPTPAATSAGAERTTDTLSAATPTLKPQPRATTPPQSATATATPANETGATQSEAAPADKAAPPPRGRGGPRGLPAPLPASPTPSPSPSPNSGTQP